MAVSFEEIEAPTFSINERGEFHGRRTFLVPFTSTAQAILELYGGWQTVGSQSFLYPPAYFPGIVGAYCNNIQAIGWPEEGMQATTLNNFVDGVTNFEKAKITANYGPLPVGSNANPPGTPIVPDGTFLRVSGTTAADFVTMPGTKLRWDSDNVALGEEDGEAAYWIGSTELIFTWMRVPRPPWGAMRAYAGAVNDSTFLGYDAETVLFMGSDFEREYTINDQTQFRVTHRFKARSQSYNELYRGDGDGVEAYERDDGTKQYPTAAFANLFVFE